jgi:altronate dehydratase
MSFSGYPRDDGQVGVRNHIGIISEANLLLEISKGG